MDKAETGSSYQRWTSGGAAPEVIVLCGPRSMNGRATRVVLAGQRAWAEAWSGSDWRHCAASIEEVLNAPPSLGY